MTATAFTTTHARHAAHATLWATLHRAASDRSVSRREALGVASVVHGEVSGRWSRVDARIEAAAAEELGRMAGLARRMGFGS